MEWWDLDYWVGVWKSEREGSIYGRRKEKVDNTEWWNQNAPAFAGRTAAKNSGKRQEKILQRILQSDFISSDSELLDIGCGPGNYALPLALKFKRVVAVDTSSRMLSILEERASNLNIHNIETVCMPWEEINLDKFGWRRKFGLVLAIKTPGINDLITLKKMIEASNNGCFYNGFTKREDKAQKDIWRLLFEEEQPPFPSDVFYVMHILYALGYLPSLEFNESYSVRKNSIKEAIQNLVLMLEPYREVPVKLNEIIGSYIEKNAVDGVYTGVRHLIEGNLMWKVAEK